MSMKKLRSQAWFARQDKMGFYYRSWLKNRGFPQDQFDGRPVIGICNTWSELTPCNSHFRTIAEHVRWGVLDAGGFPLEFPVMSLGETLLRPTAMLYRNLASMDVEESIRANPLDGVVLLMGCDKTTPSLIMGAASVDLPTIGVSGGPMLRGIHCGVPIGSGTNTISMSERLRSGQITLEEFHEAEADMHRSHGHCMTMGTASTMACMVEALGVGMPGNAAIPAVDARRNLLAREAGRRIVKMVEDDIVLSKILTREAFENAIRVNAAVGGSTNAVVHHIAMARRIGVAVDLGRLGSARPRRALPGQHHALRPVPHGGLLRGRRPACGHSRAGRARPHPQERDDRERQDDLAEQSRGAELEGRRDLSRSRPRSSATAALPCCAATWRPTAPSSSRRRPHRI